VCSAFDRPLRYPRSYRIYKRCSLVHVEVEVPEAVVAFDYAEPFQNCASIIGVAESAAVRGEPRLSLFESADLYELLRGTVSKPLKVSGFTETTERL
jgi:hypothetical protein